MAACSNNDEVRRDIATRIAAGGHQAHPEIRACAHGGAEPSTQELAAIADTVRREGFASIDGQVFHGVPGDRCADLRHAGRAAGAMSLVSNQASLVHFPNPVVDDLLATAKRASQRLGWQT